MGGTTAWKLCTLAPGTTLAVVYDIVAQHGGGSDPMASQQFFLQVRRPCLPTHPPTRSPPGCRCTACCTLHRALKSGFPLHLAARLPAAC